MWCLALNLAVILFSSDLQLMDYAFESHYNLHSAMFFGPALMLNHAPEEEASVSKTWARGVVPALDAVALRPFTNYPGVSFTARSTLKPGSEVTFAYGKEAYFAERHVPFNFQDSAEYVKSPSYALEELARVGHCLSDVYVNKSNIPMGGKGVFSKRAQGAGSTLSVSPVLLVPKHVLEKAGRSSVVMNFCFSDEGTDLALLPLGTAALINHAAAPNVAIRWYYWGGDKNDAPTTVSAQEVLAGNLTALLRSPAAPLYLEYYALRPISQDEELLLDYGAEWVEAWRKYMADTLAWTASCGDDAHAMLAAPQFRHTIAVPSGMFPESVYQIHCFGTRDCDAHYMLRQPKHLHRLLNSRGSAAHLFNLNSVAAAKHTFSLKKEVQASLDGSADSAAGASETRPVIDAIVDDDDDENSDSQCSLYLAPVLPGSGAGGRSMGLFNGIELKRGDVLDKSPSLLASMQALAALRHIAAPATRGHYLTVLYGPGATARTSSVPNMDRTYDAKDLLRVPSPQAQALRPYTLHTDMLYYATSSVQQGGELLISSGQPATEADERARRSATTYSLAELQRVGHCLTDIYLNDSAIPMAGSGVFSRRAHRVGDVVSLSPAAVVPKHVLREQASSVLINYCLTVRDTPGSSADVCVLPLGLAASMNHAARPNMGMRWRDPQPGTTAGAEELLDGQLGALLQGSATLYLEYYALRPIGPDEELTIGYGDEWEGAWSRYVAVLASWMQGGGNSTVKQPDSSSGSSGRGDLMSAPQFRQPILLPLGMLPASVSSAGSSNSPGDGPSCVGDPACAGPLRLARPPRVEDSLNREVHSRNLFQQVAAEAVQREEGGGRMTGETSGGAEKTRGSLWFSIYKFFFSFTIQ